MGLADADGLLTESYSYDAFGRRRNAQNWSYDNITTSSITDRGYTFHEHLDEFGLINMNGRVYDPLVGQLLSPDPFIQQPENSQSYNRYGYVFNNPLRFTDPSGYFASGDTTGTQQGNAESIFIRKEREDQQKERLSYNTDESTDGPGVNQLQVEGGAASVVATDISQAGLEFISAHEGYSSVIYLDIAGLETIGYGHLIKPGEDFSSGITRVQSLALFKQDAKFAVDAVNKYTTVSLNQNQFDALTSFTFNVGAGALRNSTLLREINAGNIDAIKNSFMMWNKANINGVLTPVKGLTNRRTAEYNLYNDGTY